jgi:hypothetical protein
VDHLPPLLNSNITPYQARRDEIQQRLLQKMNCWDYTNSTVPKFINTRIDRTPPTVRECDPVFSKLVKGFTDDIMLLQDIPMTKVGQFMTIARSYDRIHSSCRKLCTLVFNKYMQIIINAPHDVISWRRFFLLPAVLFTLPTTKEMKERTTILLNDEQSVLFWQTHTIKAQGLQLKRRVPKSSIVLDLDPVAREHHLDRLNKKAFECVVSNNSSKAYKLLTTSQPNTIMHDMELLQAGEALYRPVNLNHGVDPNDVSAVQVQVRNPLNDDDPKNDMPGNIEWRNNEEENYLITAQEIVLLLKKCKNKVSPGLDQIRYEHLKIMAEVNEPIPSTDAVEYRELLAQILSMLLNYCIPTLPPEIFDALCDSRLHLIPKSNNVGVRPISLNSSYRKLISGYLLHTIIGRSRERFEPLQYGISNNGAFKIVHSIRDT